MATPTVPAPGIPPGRKNLTVHLTPDLRDDLATLMRNGTRASDAIRAAIAHMANAYRAAWDYGDVPHGTPPRITGCTYTTAPPTTRARR